MRVSLSPSSLVRRRCLSPPIPLACWRSIQTRPALGPTAKILQSRRDALLTRERQQSAQVQFEYGQFRGWLKALYPLAKTIKGLPRPEVTPEETQQITANATFNRKLRHCTEFFVNNDMAPSERVLIALCANASTVGLLRVAIRVLKAAQYKGALLEDSVSAAFVRSAVHACLRGGSDQSGDLSSLEAIMGEALSETPQVAICVGPQTICALNDALAAAVATSGEADKAKATKTRAERQQFALSLLLTAAKYASLLRRGSAEATDEELAQVDRSLLRLLLRADELSATDKAVASEDFMLEGDDTCASTPVCYSDWLFAKIQLVAPACNLLPLEGEDAQAQGLLTALSQSFLRRQHSLPDWLSSK